jgi:putative flippase GtrA
MSESRTCRPAGVADRAVAWSRSRFHQLVRYAGVSAISTTTSLVTLAIGMTVLGLSAVWANLLATAIGTVPSFELNRRWVWRCGNRRSLAHQVAPFTALSFAGLGLSTLTVHLAADATTHWSTLTRTVAVELANVTAYGLLWVLQFVLLDRILFREPPGTPTERPATPLEITPVMVSAGSTSGADAA